MAEITSGAQLGRVPEFDALCPREQGWAVRGAERWFERFSRERSDATDDVRRRAIKMGFLACASTWATIWVAFALPASVLWGVLLAVRLYWLLLLPGLLTIAGLSALALSVRRFRMMRRYYPEKFATGSAFRRIVGGPT